MKSINDVTIANVYIIPLTNIDPILHFIMDGEITIYTIRLTIVVLALNFSKV
jgi:hypothetical protein